MDEVQDVSGGLVRALLIGWRIIRSTADTEKEVDGNAASEGEMPNYNG
ncbi:MAG: hypothetical protein ACKO1K_08745 [Burkholderiales bacterium]